MLTFRPYRRKLDGGAEMSGPDGSASRFHRLNTRVEIPTSKETMLSNLLSTSGRMKFTRSHRLSTIKGEIGFRAVLTHQRYASNL